MKTIISFTLWTLRQKKVAEIQKYTHSWTVLICLIAEGSSKTTSRDLKTSKTRPLYTPKSQGLINIWENNFSFFYSLLLIILAWGRRGWIAKKEKDREVANTSLAQVLVLMERSTIFLMNRAWKPSNISQYYCHNDNFIVVLITDLKGTENIFMLNVLSIGPYTEMYTFAVRAVTCVNCKFSTLLIAAHKFQNKITWMLRAWWDPGVSTYTRRHMN